jgi:hypothetical protein
MIMASLTVVGILVSKSFFTLLKRDSSEFIDRDLCVEVCFRTLIAFNLVKCVISTSAYNSICVFSSETADEPTAEEDDIGVSRQGAKQAFQIRLADGCKLAEQRIGH